MYFVSTKPYQAAQSRALQNFTQNQSNRTEEKNSSVSHSKKCGDVSAVLMYACGSYYRWQWQELSPLLHLEIAVCC